MRKALLHGPRDLRIEEVADPTPASGEAVVRVRRASLCYTDVKAYLGIRVLPYPRGLGHDASGVVEAIGPGVDGLSIGQAVTPLSWAGCGSCRMCRAGHPNACVRRPRDFSRAPEWLVERLCLPVERILPVPPGVTLDDAALLEPVYTALNARELLGYAAGDWLLVVGVGSMGIGQVAVARATGAGVIGVDLVPGRLDLAQRFGAQHVFSPREGDLAQRIGAIFGERLPFVVDTTGVASGLSLAMELGGMGARIATLGAYEPLVVHDLVTQQQSLTGVFNGHQKREAMALIQSGQIDLKPAVSHRFPFERAAQALEFCADRRELVSKCVIEFD